MEAWFTETQVVQKSLHILQTQMWYFERIFYGNIALFNKWSQTTTLQVSEQRQLVRDFTYFLKTQENHAQAVNLLDPVPNPPPYPRSICHWGLNHLLEKESSDQKNEVKEINQRLSTLREIYRQHLNEIRGYLEKHRDRLFQLETLWGSSLKEMTPPIEQKKKELLAYQTQISEVDSLYRSQREEIKLLLTPKQALSLDRGIDISERVMLDYHASLQKLSESRHRYLVSVREGMVRKILADMERLRELFEVNKETRRNLDLLKTKEWSLIMEMDKLPDHVYQLRDGERKELEKCLGEGMVIPKVLIVLIGEYL